MGNSRYFQKGAGSNTGSEAVWGGGAQIVVYARHNASNVLTGGHQTTASFPGGLWVSIVITHDQTSGALTAPVIYENGVAQSLSTLSVTAGIAQNSTDPFIVGNRDVQDRPLGNTMGHFAVWDGALLTAREAAALAAGVSPLGVRPSALVCYLPMAAVNPQVDLRLNGAVTMPGGTPAGSTVGLPPCHTFPLLQR